MPATLGEIRPNNLFPDPRSPRRGRKLRETAAGLVQTVASDVKEAYTLNDGKPVPNPLPTIEVATVGFGLENIGAHIGTTNPKLGGFISFGGSLIRISSASILFVKGVRGILR